MNETIRAYLTRRVRWCLANVVGGWVVFILSGIVAERSPNPIVLALGALMFGGGAFALQWIKCPRCSVRLGQIAITLGIPGLKPKPNFCPYCGVSLDEPRAKQIPVGQQVPFNPIR